MIRAATVADYPAYAALCGELGIDHPRPLPRWRTGQMASTLVAEQDGHVCGYVAFDRLGQLGHVWTVVVSRDARNGGVGGALLRATAAALRASGATEWQLDVKADNTAAIHLTERRLGMRVEHRSTVLRVRWDRLTELAGDPATALPVAPEEDADVERALALPAGRIGMARGRPDQLLVQLRDPDLAVAGFAAFDPGLPTALPFRVARATLAGTLLRALRRHARHDHLQLVIEDHPELADLLIAQGAEVRLQLLHFRGLLTP